MEELDQGELLTAFTKIAQVTHPEYQALARPRVLNHVRVTIMDELDQCPLHPSIKHPKTDMPWSGFEPPTSCTTGGNSVKELS
jgi:hypothetical protein